MRLRSSLSPQQGTSIVRGTAEPRERRPLGEVLNLDTAQQQAVVQRQSVTGRLFGETALELGLVTNEQVRRAIEQQQGFSVLKDDDARVDPLVISAFDPDDVLARVARNLRSTVTAALRDDGQSVRSVALIGCDAGIELPVLTANLAVACAQTGISTLLVDANLDHPHQHALFRVPNRIGLATMLAGNQIGGMVHPAAISGLSLLTSGPAIPNASELFDRQRLANAIELLIEDFELVLVDAGCEVTGIAAALGLDAAIVVLRRNVTLVRDLNLLVRQLEANKLVVLGTILVD